MSNYEELVAQLKDTADKYAGVIEDASLASLLRRPDEKNWSPVEIICHMRDVEELFSNRFQIMLVVETYEFPSLVVDQWAIDRQYLRNDAFEALSAFRRRREEMLKFLKTLKPELWERVGIHPKRGQMSIADNVKLIAVHDNNHLDQLKRALAGQS